MICSENFLPTIKYIVHTNFDAVILVALELFLSLLKQTFCLAGATFKNGYFIDHTTKLMCAKIVTLQSVCHA